MEMIWIIEDDLEMAQAVELMVRLLHYETRIFTHAKPAASELLAGKKPDLIILDLRLPDVNGLEFLTFLRKGQAVREIPVVILSTETSEISVDAAMTLGADEYLVKPVLLDELRSALIKSFNARGRE